MENKHSSDTLMLRGLGAAAFASAAAFVSALILKYAAQAEFLLYVIIPAAAAVTLLMLLSANVREVGIKLATFLLTGAAFCLIFIRVGFVAAISRDMEKGLLNGTTIKLFGSLGIAAALTAAVISLLSAVILSKNEKYCSFTDKTDGFQQKLSVPSIAAAFISLAVASMIYG